MRATRVWLVLLGLAAALPVAAQIGEGNLVKNPGFEEAAAENGYLGWVFVNHNQDFVRSGLQAVDYHSGLKAAFANVPQKLQVYVSWAQHIQIKDDTQLPDEVSLWYRAPDNPFTLVMGFTGFEGGKSVTKGGVGLTVPKNPDWQEFKQKVEVPFGTRDIMLELRVTTPGNYTFDDVVLTQREKPDTSGKPNRILFVGADKVTYLWQQELEAAQAGKITYEKWDNLTATLLKQTRCVVIVTLPSRSEVTARDQALTQLLVDYIQAGGGLMFTQTRGQVLTDATLAMHLAKTFGTRILLEKTTSDPAQGKQVGPWGADYYTWTDQVSGPVAEGVKGVAYQSTVDMGSYSGVLPFLVQDPWQVVLNAGPKSHSEPHLYGLEEVDRDSRPEGFKENVPLAGTRDMGKGRVAYFGMYSGTVFTRPISSDDDKVVHEAYLTKGWEGHPSDTLRLYVNTFKWLSANADQVATADLKLAPHTAPDYTKEYKLMRGVIGARTKYSAGTSTADEYVAAAKAAGLDFIVFLEEFAAMKPEDFPRLREDCRRLSDGKFLAIPGLTYENTDGNHQFAFGRYVRLPSKLLLDPTGKRFQVLLTPDGPQVDIHWLYTLLGFENHSGWYLFGKNPYPHYDARDVDCMGVITQEGGKTLERLPLEYGLEARNGQFMWPLALTLMKNAGEMSLVQSGTYFCNTLGVNGTEQLESYLNTLQARGGQNLFPGSPCFGHVFLSNGPTIELTMPRGDTDAEGDIWNPRLQEWQNTLKVTSPVGLKEVRLMDGLRQIRRWLPGGAKEFKQVAAIPRERQKHLWVIATDTQGHEAWSRDIRSDSWLLRENQCADRNNQLLYSMQTRPDGTPFFICYGGDTSIPDKGPWNGRCRPVGLFVFDQKLGVGAMSYDGSPERHPQASMNPCVVYDGEPIQGVGWVNQLVGGREGGPHVRPWRVVSCSDVLVGERQLDGVFPLAAKPIIHVWHTMYPVTPSKYMKVTYRTYQYLTKVDGVGAYLWDCEFTPLQDIPVKPESAYTFYVGNVGASTATEFLRVTGGQVAVSGPLKAHPVERYPYSRGDYIGLLKSPFGSLAAYSLTDGLVLAGDGVNHGVGIKVEGAAAKAGTTYRAQVLLVGMHRMVDDPVKLAAQIAQDYGLGCEPGYSVTATSGKVVSREYLLKLAAGADRTFRGKLTGVEQLAGNLGATVSGLNDNWAAVTQQQGTPVKTRMMAVEQGVGYAVLRAEDEGKPLFLGHPVIADKPEVVLALARSTDWKQWVLEIHNPTEKALTVTVRSNPAFVGAKLLEKLTVPAGSSVMRTLGPTGY